MKLILLFIPNLLLVLFASFSMPQVGIQFVARSEIAKFFSYQQLVMFFSIVVWIFLEQVFHHVDQALFLALSTMLSSVVIFSQEKLSIESGKKELFYFVQAVILWALGGLLAFGFRPSHEFYAMSAQGDFVTSQGAGLYFAIIFFFMVGVVYLYRGKTWMREDFFEQIYSKDDRGSKASERNFMRTLIMVLILELAIFNMGVMTALGMSLIVPFVMLLGQQKGFAHYRGRVVTTSMVGASVGFLVGLTLDLPLSYAVIAGQSLVALLIVLPQLRSSRL